jgi:hypothetical protein
MSSVRLLLTNMMAATSFMRRNQTLKENLRLDNVIIDTPFDPVKIQLPPWGGSKRRNSMMSQVTRGPRTLSARGKPYHRMCAGLNIPSPTDTLYVSHSHGYCLGCSVYCVVVASRQVGMIIPGYQSKD